MDKVEERKRKRNERRREAYQSMQPEDKAKLLERRRQRYGERMVRLRSQLEIESGTSPAQENQNFSEAILAQTSTPPCISELQNVVNEYPTNNVQVLDHAVSDDVIHELMPDPTYTNEYHSPPRNRHYDRFSRLKSIATSPWELPVASQCQFCQAYKFFREPPAFCCANGEVSLAPMTPNPILLNLFTVDTSGIGIRFRRRVRTYNNHLALTSIGMKTDPQFCWSNQGIERNSHSRGVSAAYCAGENSVAPALGLSASTILEVENQVYTQNRRKRTNVSCREHTAFRCQIRD